MSPERATPCAGDNEAVGMFDWYEPAEEHRCPVCDVVLSEWQGKDGPCALYVWRQGQAAPVDQRVDDDVKGARGVRAAERLPSRFEIYSHDCGRHDVTAVCACVDAIWRLTEVTDARPFDVNPSTWEHRSDIRHRRDSAARSG
jgi:hypothetical protein